MGKKNKQEKTPATTIHARATAQCETQAKQKKKIKKNAKKKGTSHLPSNIYAIRK